MLVSAEVAEPPLEELGGDTLNGRPVTLLSVLEVVDRDNPTSMSPGTASRKRTPSGNGLTPFGYRRSAPASTTTSTKGAFRTSPATTSKPAAARCSPG